MENLKTQTVYLPVKVEDELPEKDGEYGVLSKCNVSYPLESYDTLKFQNGKFQEIPNWNHIHWIKPQEGYFFTPEQLNEDRANVIRQTLETAAERVKDEIACDSESTEHYNLSVKPSITNTFEETFNKLKV